MEKNLKAVLSNRIYLTRTPEVEEHLVSELTYELAPEGPNNKTPIRICNFSGVSEHICSIPIGRQDLIPKDYTIIDKRINIEIDFPDFSKDITLRPSQQEIVDVVKDNYIINAVPGFGKSYTALGIAYKLKRKTLIIVNTLKLRDQWAKDIKKVFNIEAGIIGSGKFNIDSPIVVANIQTLVKKILKVQNEFGLIICDETHRLPSKTFNEVLDKLRARYKIGLTATLGRKDKKHIIIPNFISRKIFIPKKENVIDPIIIVYSSEFVIPGNLMVPWATRINQLSYNKLYQKEVVNLVNAQAERGHKVLVLSDRVKFLEDCAAITPYAVCVTAKTKNQKELEKSVVIGERKVLYGSIGIYKEGISINELSCLVLASPINNIYLIEQVVGRIMRKAKDKMKPEVIDIKMDGTTGKKQFRTRKSYYLKEGFKIVYL